MSQDTSRNPSRLLSARFLSLILLLLAGCTPGATFRLANATEKPARSVVVFFVDGLDKTRLKEAARQSFLPNISRFFIKGGVGVEHAVTSIPAITYPNSVSLLTGCFPGHHGVMGNQWFDREKLLLRDYGSAATYRRVNDDFDRPTLFEILDDHFTVGVRTHTDRGADEIVDHPVTSGFDWAFGAYARVDARVGESAREVLRMADRAGRWPSVYWSYFPGLDEVGHRTGPDSVAYLEAMRTVDASIGKIIATVQQARPAERVYYVLVTDHNHLPASPKRSFDLAEWLRQKGYRVHTGPLQSNSEAARRAHFDRFDAVVIDGAYRRGALFLRNVSQWRDPPSPRLVRNLMGLGEDDALQSRLFDHPAIALACWPVSDHAVEVRSPRGAAIVERRGAPGAREYRLRFSAEANSAESNGPLGYLRSPSLRSFAQEGWHDSRAWLAATAGERYPDFVPQIVEFFDSPRAGDVVLFAAEGWSFDGAWRGGHGSCLAEDMDVPLYFAGPGLPEGCTIDCARTVDVLPTVLDLLGERGRLDRVKPIDGVSLLPALRAAPQP